MYDIEVRELEEQPAAITRARVEEHEVPTWCVGAYSQVIRHLKEHDISTVGLPFARCAKDEAGYDVEAGLPVSQPLVQTEPSDPVHDPAGTFEVLGITLPGGRAATTWHRGAYPDIGEAYEAIAAWVQDAGTEIAGPPWEVYHSPPTANPDEPEWQIEVIQPITG